jgi:hypothetical protein
MYELVRLSFHNWYAFEARDLDVNGMIAVIGPSGAGKSAILDGIQVVITGDNHNFIDLNPSAGEKSDRTVLSYCLGQISDFERGEPRRERTETILALTFRNKETGVPIAIGVLLQADHGERTETVRARFVARNYEFSFSDFIERDADGDEIIVSHDDVIDRLKRRCGKELTLHTVATQFVAEFLTAMRPRSSPEARIFLRSFNNAVLAREIKDPTDFVRRFVLEAEPLNVERIRSSIDTWRSLEKRAQALESELRTIRAVRARFATWARQALQSQTEEYVAISAERMRYEFEISDLEKQKARADEERARLERLIANHSAAVEEYRNEVLRKRTMRAESAEGAKIRTIEVEEREAGNDKARAEQTFGNILQDLTAISQFATLGSFIPIRYHAAIDAASQIVGNAKGKPLDRLGADIETLAAEARNASSILEARDALTQQRNARVEEVAALGRTIAELEQSLGSAGDGRGSMLSAHVRQLMDDLAMRGIQCIALPDAVEILDDSWAVALEMLLGPNREALIVPEAQVEQAFEYLWRNRARWHGCRIINTRKTRSAGGYARTLPANSIAQIVKTDDPDVRTFIDTQIGRYVCADSERDLDGHERAVMRNGKTSSGLALRVYRDVSPILGRTAQVAAVAAARDRLATLAVQLKQKSDERSLLDAGISRLTTLAAAGDIEPRLRQASEEIRRSDMRLKALAKDRENVEDRNGEALRKDIELLEQQCKSYVDELAELREADRKQILAADGAAIRIAERQEAVTKAKLLEQNLQDQQSTERNARLVAFAEAEELTIEAAKNKLLVETFQKRGEEKRYLAERRELAKASADELGRAAKENAARALNSFGEYVRQWIEGPSPLPEDADHAEHCFWCATREHRLEEHELRPHRERVVEARREFEAALKEDLLAKMSDRFEKVATQLDTLNRRLAGYTFVGRRYSFKRSVAVDFKPLYDLVRRVIGNQEASFAALTEQGAIADDEMKGAMAQVEEIVTREQDTKRLEDYRNYFEFELFLENQAGEQQAFSKLVGLLSGGQRQAPYYVAIAASMVSVYFPRGPREENADGMGLVAFDEAFNKLDIGNTQNLIKLYRDLGLQLVIAAPEVHRATFLECVDCIISVTRMHNTDEVSVDAERIGPRARAEMAAANPEHLGVDWFRTAIAQMPDKAAE